jgi:hypothetical protein
MTHALSDKRGRIHIKGVKITFKPGTDRLITTPRDGFHCKHKAVGPIIEDGLFEGMLDEKMDVISLDNIVGGVVKDNLIMPGKTATPVRMRNCKEIKEGK